MAAVLRARPVIGAFTPQQLGLDHRTNPTDLVFPGESNPLLNGSSFAIDQYGIRQAIVVERRAQLAPSKEYGELEPVLVNERLRVMGSHVLVHRDDCR